MDKKSRIINSVLLIIMAICFSTMFLYGLLFMYSKIGLNILSGNTFKSNMGDAILYFIMPLVLVFMGIYRLALKKYSELSKDENEDLEN